MNLQRREEIRMIAECPNDMHWAQEMRRAVAELLAHIDALEQAAAERVIRDGGMGPMEAPAVVVPELTRRQSTDIANEAQMITGRSIWPSTVEAIAKIMRLRSVPADRAVGEGMVQISAELLAAYEELWDMARIRCRATTEKEYGEQWRKIDALRANQGGVAT